MVEESSGSGVSDDAEFSEFLRISGLRIEEVGGDTVRGWIDLDEQHHTPWGGQDGDIAVVGTDTMGAGIAESAALAGMSVAMIDIGEDALERGMHKC